MSGLSPDTPDELAASLGVRYPSPARARTNVALRRRDLVPTPLAPRSPNLSPRKQENLNLDVTSSLLRRTSPSKSMFFDPDPEQDVAESPWRIKVTVQAEPRHGSSVSKSPAPRIRTVRVPLKDADVSPAGQKSAVGRKRKSEANSAVKNRKGTPMKRRSTRLSNGLKQDDSIHEEDTPIELSKALKRRRGRPRKDMPPKELNIAQGQQHELPSEVDTEPMQRSSPDLIRDRVIKMSQDQKKVRQGNQQEHEDAIHVDNFEDDAHANGQLLLVNIDLKNNGEQKEMQAKEARIRKTTPVTEQNLNQKSFDFTSLTPLHLKHPLPPTQKEQTSVRQHISGKNAHNGASNDPLDRWKHRFTPLPQRDSPGKSLLPQSNPSSTPTSESDASMWRSMISGQHRKSPHRVISSTNQIATAFEQPEFGGDYEEEMPENNTQIMGDTTMMQSEDFSMVSLSSLPSAKDIHSSIFEQSERATTGKTSSAEQSRLAKVIAFSPPLSQVIQSQTTHQMAEGAVEFIGADSKNPQATKDASPESDLRPETQHKSSLSYHFNPIIDGSRLTHASDNPSLRQDLRTTGSGKPPQQRPDNGDNRFPTPSSGEKLSPTPEYPGMNAWSDVIYPELVNSEHHGKIQDTPTKSEADMSTPPATPQTDKSPNASGQREMRPSSSSSRRSLISGLKSSRIISLERKWQEERDNVKRTLASAKGDVVHVESDAESTAGDGAYTPAINELSPSVLSIQNETADIWQDISASYEEPPNIVSKRKYRSAESRLAILERPSKAARTAQRQNASSLKSVEDGEALFTPKKSFNTEEGISSVHRRAKTKSDISAIFDRLGNRNQSDERVKQSVQAPTVEASRMSQSYDVSRVDTTDISALSDVRQLHNEAMQARRQPPFPLMQRGTTTTVPTKLKSVDDTWTTKADEDLLKTTELDASGRVIEEQQSVTSFTGLRRPARSLFRHSSDRRGADSSANSSDVLLQQSNQASAASSSISVRGIFSFIWNAVTFSQPYTPPPRPDHPILSGRSAAFPQLPRIQPWSLAHWQTLDNLYQYYKRKPHHFSPSRSAHPDNRNVITPTWKKFVGVIFDHWGYRVKLEDSHIVLAILFMQLLVLPSEKEYISMYGKTLEVTCDCAYRCGRITEWDVLVKLFAVVAGELIREDENEGRRVRRDLTQFRYRLAGQHWKDMTDTIPEL
ncbi:uncharacterized protein PV09_04739 [Verruconis gallopava]|uniref:Uncharacterized protein n=1 Tax=Verruconis gallopava TaxID=253628 RepID=A0A0D1XMU0_9PEZI|nr:uncharacterized protein PV09_04739 [Verruconis gallopava]KIW03896.1 hypothetical protein PV09_04739 [Verruconis gallopava]